MLSQLWSGQFYLSPGSAVHVRDCAYVSSCVEFLFPYGPTQLPLLHVCCSCVWYLSRKIYFVLNVFISTNPLSAYIILPLSVKHVVSRGIQKEFKIRILGCGHNGCFCFFAIFCLLVEKFCWFVLLFFFPWGNPVVLLSACASFGNVFLWMRANAKAQSKLNMASPPPTSAALCKGQNKFAFFHVRL